MDVAFLVVGDPFGATTHTDLIIRATEKQIKFQVVHNASILNAVGCCGLQLYSFGETISIPYWSDSWQPDSFYDKINVNVANNFHTLCLLGKCNRFIQFAHENCSCHLVFFLSSSNSTDIRVKEPTLESLIKKKREYQPPRFMSVSEASQQLLEIVKKRRVSGCTEAELAYTEQSLFVGLARVGHETQAIKACSLLEMAETDLGAPLHSLILPARKLHPLEIEYLQQFAETKLLETI